MLSGVTIITEEPPIRVKNDTIEFKASLFKVRPDSNVETLLKQLPGLQRQPAWRGKRSKSALTRLTWWQGFGRE